MTTSTKVRGASLPQMNYINDLMQKREVPADLMALATADLLSIQTATNLIDALKACPWKRTNGNTGSFVPANQVANLEEGTYTVVNGSDYVTIRIAREAWCDGKMVASYLFGSDNDYSYKAFAFVTPSGVRPFKSFASNTRLVEAAKTLLTVDIADAREAFILQAEKYALRSGKCLNCLHTLTVPTSLHRGLGPVCARKLGVT